MSESNPTSEVSKDKDQAAKKQRSPAYPSVGLQDAVAKVTILWKKDKGAAQGLPVMAAHWETSAKSSGFLQLISTLKQFGLLDELDVELGRQFKLTARAKDIVMFDGDQANPIRQKAIKEAALAPKIHAELWKNHGLLGMPSDSNLMHWLVTNKGFTPAAASDLIRNFKKTISFAKLGEGDTIQERNQEIAVGDFVQWESQGAMQFSKPRKVTGLSEDGQWVFVEETLSGLPVADIRKVDAVTQHAATLNAAMDDAAAALARANAAAAVPPVNPNFKPPPPVAGIRQFTLTTDTGDVVVKWPEAITDEDYETIEGWLDGLKKKIKRSVKTDDTNKTDA